MGHFQRRQEIVAREQQVDRLLRVGAVDNPVGEGQGAFAGDAAPQVVLEDLMIDGGEVAVDVATQDMAVAVAEFSYRATARCVPLPSRFA